MTVPSTARSTEAPGRACTTSTCPADPADVVALASVSTGPPKAVATRATPRRKRISFTAAPPGSSAEARCFTREITGQHACRARSTADVRHGANRQNCPSVRGWNGTCWSVPGTTCPRAPPRACAGGEGAGSGRLRRPWVRSPGPSPPHHVHLMRRPCQGPDGNGLARRHPGMGHVGPRASPHFSGERLGPLGRVARLGVWTRPVTVGTGHQRIQVPTVVAPSPTNTRAIGSPREPEQERCCCRHRRGDRAHLRRLVRRPPARGRQRW